MMLGVYSRCHQSMEGLIGMYLPVMNGIHLYARWEPCDHTTRLGISIYKGIVPWPLYICIVYWMTLRMMLDVYSRCCPSIYGRSIGMKFLHVMNGIHLYAKWEPCEHTTRLGLSIYKGTVPWPLYICIVYWMTLRTMLDVYSRNLPSMEGLIGMFLHVMNGIHLYARWEPCDHTTRLSISIYKGTVPWPLYICIAYQMTLTMMLDVYSRCLPSMEGLTGMYLPVMNGIHLFGWEPCDVISLSAHDGTGHCNSQEPWTLKDKKCPCKNRVHKNSTWLVTECP